MSENNDNENLHNFLKRHAPIPSKAANNLEDKVVFAALAQKKKKNPWWHSLKFQFTITAFALVTVLLFVFNNLNFKQNDMIVKHDTPAVKTVVDEYNEINLAELEVFIDDIASFNLGVQDSEELL